MKLFGSVRDEIRRTDQNQVRELEGSYETH